LQNGAFWRSLLHGLMLLNESVQKEPVLSLSPSKNIMLARRNDGMSASDIR
jgi:hypothetical protein